MRPRVLQCKGERMEPTIYKPSIYKGAGIYKTGAEGGGGDEPVIYYDNIGGKNYPYVKIGSLYWLAENLDYLGDNIPLKTLAQWQKNGNVIQAAYYNDDLDFAHANKLGLLYDYGAVLQLRNEDLNGWRVPNKNDWDKLINTCWGEGNAAMFLKARDGYISDNFPQDWHGLDKYSFCMLPGGILGEDSSHNPCYSDVGTYSYTFLYRDNSSWFRTIFSIDAKTNYIHDTIYNGWYGRYMRLCKNA